MMSYDSVSREAAYDEQSLAVSYVMENTKPTTSQSSV